MTSMDQLPISKPELLKTYSGTLQIFALYRPIKACGATSLS